MVLVLSIIAFLFSVVGFIGMFFIVFVDEGPSSLHKYSEGEEYKYKVGAYLYYIFIFTGMIVSYFIQNRTLVEKCWVEHMPMLSCYNT